MTGPAHIGLRAQRLALAAVLSCLAGLEAQAGDASLAVQIVTVRTVADIRDFTLTGVVVARNTLSPSFPASGRITALPVSQGDHVTKGTVLARLDSVQQQQALQSAEAALATAKANAERAREDADRQDGLLASGATTVSARDAAANALRAAEAGVAQAEADLASAKKALADTILHAPADATVTEKMAEVGQVVGAAQPVLQLALGDQYDAIFQVPEALPARMPDKPVAVSLAPVDRPGDKVIGAPRLVSPLVDPSLGTVKVTVGMPSLPRGMHIGDPIVGSVALSGEPRIVLPWSSITATQKGPAVWVVDPATHAVSLRQVDVLRYESEKIVISGGLKDGEDVVGLGASLLYPGRIVRQAEGP